MGLCRKFSKTAASYGSESDYEETKKIKAEDPTWLIIARNELGVSEIPGPANAPRVIEYHQKTSLKAKKDSVPWCSSFVNFCMAEAGMLGTNSAAARSWLKWGAELEEPRIGCVVVFWRKGKNSAYGHVGFYVGETETHVLCLGGNQKDKVCVMKYPKSRVLGYRWPS